MPGLKQPLLGAIATTLVIAVSLAFISLFDFTVFSGWVSYCLLCVIPMQIVIGVRWGYKHPRFAASREQPMKGILLTLISAATGLVVGTAYFYGAGGGIDPPAPMLVMCTVVSVVVMFNLAIMWGGWPFSFLRNSVAAGLALVLAAYSINYLLFRLLFNYEFMKGAPVYVASLDPHGLFNAWNAQVFYVTALGVMFLMLHFDLWPLTKRPALMRQPVLGAVWTAITLVLGGVLFYFGTGALAMDAPQFMVLVPVPFIFGTIVVLNMMQGSLWAKQVQPVRGILNATSAAVIGSLLAAMYRALAPLVTAPVKTGPPSYDAEIWLASALLAVTFPFLIFYSEFFNFWPLVRSGQTSAR